MIIRFIPFIRSSCLFPIKQDETQGKLYDAKIDMLFFHEIIESGTGF
ncbi:hypothetical protein CM49_05605 [Paenibacillus sp. P1XP2]|nr:hypothetical protein CM49_05605 [Paenibacillus sp. P1XP2]